MKKHKKRISSYDDMMANYYGNMHQSHQHHHHHKQKDKDNVSPGAALVVSKSFDNGEILEQAGAGYNNPFQEYVLQSSVPDFEEYVVANNPWKETSTSQTKIEIPTIQDISDKYGIDIMDPMKYIDSNTNTTQYDDYGQSDPFATSRSLDIPVAEVIADSKKSELSDDDFMKDLEAIVKGEKRYNQETKQMESTSAPQSYSSQQSAKTTPSPEFKNEHAIFDRIAQSMQYANAYDMGTMELENRFSDFDRIADFKEKEKGMTDKKKETAKAAPSTETKAGNAEFIQDLDAIKKKQAEKEVRAEQTPTETAAPTKKETPPVTDITAEEVKA